MLLVSYFPKHLLFCASLHYTIIPQTGLDLRDHTFSADPNVH